MYNILICDDQVDIVNALKIYLAPEGYRLFEAFDGAQALELVKTRDIHLVLLAGGYRIAKLSFYETLVAADIRMKPVFEKLGWKLPDLKWIGE